MTFLHYYAIFISIRRGKLQLSSIDTRFNFPENKIVLGTLGLMRTC